MVKRRRVGGLAAHYERRKHVNERLRRILCEKGEPLAMLPTYVGFVEEARKEWMMRGEAVDVGKLVEEWTRKGARREVLERLAKLLPGW